jgi:hypothetical protein
MIAFAPVAFMLRSLKNDILVLEYPIKYFMSESLHAGRVPLWFNTWAMGFPLQSNITWGVYSTPQFFFSGLFHYSIYTLHIEFMFYVMMSGWSMFYLLKKHFTSDETLAQLLACCFMLSGFVTGSSQWLLYITAASFTPLALHALLQLLKSPSARNAFFFALFYYLMFTNVYQAFNIISSYCFAGIVLYWLAKKWQEKIEFKKTLGWVCISMLLTVLFCFPVLYYSIEVLRYLTRGNGIVSNANFFESNYLHPAALKTMLLPFSSVRLHYANTEGTMMDSYMGLATILLLVISFSMGFLEKRKLPLFLLSLAVFFFLVSFGAWLPLRGWLNVLPGFSYFRNTGIFRFFAIAVIFIFIAYSLRDQSFKILFGKLSVHRQKLFTTVFVLVGLCLLAVALYFGKSNPFDFSSLYSFVKNLDEHQTVLISAIVQLALLLLILIFLRNAATRILKWVFLLDLCINCLLCTPFFTVSSYSIKEAGEKLHAVPGFPIQQKDPPSVLAMMDDEKGNAWMNMNVFGKEISSQPGYFGPLILQNTDVEDRDTSGAIYPPKALTWLDITSTGDTMNMTKMLPNEVVFQYDFTKNHDLHLLQNYFPGWEGSVNGKRVAVMADPGTGIFIPIKAGRGSLSFIFKKNGVVISALIMHLIVIAGLVVFFAKRNMAF